MVSEAIGHDKDAYDTSFEWRLAVDRNRKGVEDPDKRVNFDYGKFSHISDPDTSGSQWRMRQL